MRPPAWLLLLLISLLAPAQPSTRTPSTPKARSAAAAPQQTDAQIQARIRAKLAKSKIGANGFKFTTANGITTIEGTANVIQHKGAATRLAKSAGSRAVVNNIQIPAAAREAARARLAGARKRATVINRSEPRSQLR